MAQVPSSSPYNTLQDDALCLLDNYPPSFQSQRCMETLEDNEEFLGQLRCNKFSDMFRLIYITPWNNLLIYQPGYM